MGNVKKKIDQQGRISIIGILGGTNIKPGDLVEVIPEKNKIILKAVKEDKREGVIESVAGKWKNRPDIVADILNLRRDEDGEALELD